MVTPLKMKYSGKVSPAGVDGLNLGKNGKGLQTPTKVMKGPRDAGKMYKAPGNISQQGKNAIDKSSGQSLPSKQSGSDKTRYTQAKQPAQFSNLDNGGMKGTRFVC